MVEILNVRRWEKKHRINFYWVMPLMHISNIETLCDTKTWYSSKIFMNILPFWHRKLYIKTWYSFLVCVLRHFGSKYLKQFSTYRLDVTYTTDTSRPKSVDFSCKEYIIWEYSHILIQKLCMNTWYSSKIFMNFSCLIF